jgi:hypothetical protein
MSIWGKLGREYYSWYVKELDLLERYMIAQNIDVDYYCKYNDRHLYTLSNQCLLEQDIEYINDEDMFLDLAAPNELATHGRWIHTIRVARARIF